MPNHFGVVSSNAGCYRHYALHNQEDKLLPRFAVMGHRYYAAVRAAFHADLPRTVFDNHSELGLCIALLLDCSILPDASLSVSNPNNSLDWPASAPLWPRRDQ